MTKITSVGTRGKLNFGMRVSMAHFVAVVGCVSMTHRGSSMPLAATRMTTSLSKDGEAWERDTSAEVGSDKLIDIGWEGEETDVIWLGILASTVRSKPASPDLTFEEPVLEPSP